MDYYRLAQEYIVDMWSRIEDERLYMVKRGKEFQLSRTPIFHLSRAGNENRPEVYDAQQKWYTSLPASFLGSEAWTRQQVQDAMTLCKEFGNPTLYITMTTNPEWLEIKGRLRSNQKASDAPWIVVQVFHQKMKQMLKILQTPAAGFRYMVSILEFQKRGLPIAMSSSSFIRSYGKPM